MKGYLLKQEKIRIGEPYFTEVHAAENDFVVVFEDDGETGYFYAAENDPTGKGLKILDMVYVYDVESIPQEERDVQLSIIWSTDWQKCALILGNTCHAIFDFEHHGGYSLAEFPPPNDIWTQHPRKLTSEMLKEFF
jgi:hypothetical protein